MARKVICQSGKVAYVTNIRADGTRCDSMEGVVIRETEETKDFFIIYRNILESIQKRQAEEELRKKLAELDEKTNT